MPAYRRPLRGRFGAGIRRGVEEALAQFVDLVADPELDRSASDAVYRGLGRGEHRERRSLDALLAAYRLGARVAWRRVSAVAIEARVDRRTLALLAEAVFAYIDELSALSADGYARGAVGRRRGARAASAAGSRRCCSIPSPTRPRSGRGRRGRLGAAGADRRARLAAGTAAACARGCRRRPLVAEPAGRRRAASRCSPIRSARASTDARARGRRRLVVLGPAGRAVAARGSADRARAVRSADRGRRGRGGRASRSPTTTSAALVAHGDEPALAELAGSRLAPLDAETPASRERLDETLRSWLDHQGEVARVAAELHVHPQTVRYRLARLRERFGDALEDPAARFELALALRQPGFARPHAGNLRSKRGKENE